MRITTHSTPGRAAVSPDTYRTFGDINPTARRELNGRCDRIAVSEGPPHATGRSVVSLSDVAVRRPQVRTDARDGATRTEAIARAGRAGTSRAHRIPGTDSRRGLRGVPHRCPGCRRRAPLPQTSARARARDRGYRDKRGSRGASSSYGGPRGRALARLDVRGVCVLPFGT